MEVFIELFKSPMGMLSLFTIIFIICMAGFLFFWVKKKVDRDAKRKSLSS